ncbi:hypothetical protein [Deminuibacter soli]|uniref:CCDC81-like prokaryotic HU domain-containing protein n=1 Tax=Deminuibacter soli TaxID=2291815 RepID=A0A3E1NIC8_9BACT|nr:hypothetical protein [Deminuibacter soli]RFM27574.1 hypothetical protein DXN05_12705 [Deminuibacter soli]
MMQTLYKYLILNKKLALPGIGYFTVEHVPARLDFASKKMYPPISVIRFSGDKVQADRHFFAFVSDDLQVNEVEAIQQFNNTLLEIKKQIADNGVAVLPQIGSLRKEFSNTYSFQPAASAGDYTPEVTAERVIRHEAHTVKVGEAERTSEEMREMLADGGSRKSRWWIYALILAALGGGAIAYYYLTRVKL